MSFLLTFRQRANDPHTVLPPGWHEASHKFALHPAILDMLERWEPADYILLIHEWPHVSEVENTMLAYAPSLTSYVEDRYVRTRVGRYLKRHWPNVPDHEIAKIANKYALVDSFAILTKTEDIVAALHYGPKSCMRWDDEKEEDWYRNMQMYWKEKYDEITDPDWYLNHPYASYCPTLGWGMAIRFKKDDPKRVLGRALVQTVKKIWVRSYTTTSEERSSNDDLLEAWLSGQGYRKKDSWPEGTQLIFYNNLVPYIDGDRRTFYISCDRIYLDDTGDLVADCTNGEYSERDPFALCEDCDDSIWSEDDAYEVYFRDRLLTVCSSCQDNYVPAHACINGRTDIELVNEDDVIDVLIGNSDEFEEWSKYLLSDSIIELDIPYRNYKYAHTDVVVALFDGSTAYTGDPDVFERPDGQYGHKSIPEHVETEVDHANVE